ncbi:putative glycosyltransferase [Shimia isoporae]|uniref:Putative glycosyltransferase n=1 Tax=Shimia isoporae TaxID=647720 RepID=A0A4R1N8S9_9RHOB|nr:glycosyltransferase [Shimia isoporae]TCL01514.1 putative glycosyltransferase [Shimia isoporae]
MNILISVTHLLGTGHLGRALTLGRAFSKAGHHVAVLTGGRPAPHLDATGVQVIQAPSLASDGTNFTKLLCDDGREADADYLQRRSSYMVAALQDQRPDVFITELFPFGRRSLSAEFLALLAACESMDKKPVVLGSVRDILAPPSKPEKAMRARDILLQHYDGVLVHSDPSVTALTESWPVTADVGALLKYTGYVAQEPAGAHPDGVGAGEVVVSAGGGSVGQALFEAAIEAARGHPLSWRILVGGTDRDDRIAALRKRAGTLQITIEPVRPDFRQMLSGAAASVSMCGYNTAMDLLQSGVPAVLVPFDDGGEVEQTLRGRSLATQGGFEVLMAQDVSAHTLSREVARVLKSGKRSVGGLRMDGAAESVRIVESMVAESPS